MAKKTTTPKKSYSLNIIDFLKHIDARDYEKYKSLSDEDKKSIAPLVLMRWMSSTWDGQTHRYYCQAVNEMVNKNFWDLANHKDLQMRLLFATGLGKSIGHRWIKANISKKIKTIDDFIKEFYDCSNDEVEVIKLKLNKEDYENILFYYGVPEKDWKKYIE